MNKEELALKINESLGFGDDSIAFEKLSKDDLIRLYEKTKEPKILIMDMLARRGEDAVATLLTQFGKDADKLGRGKLIKKFLDLIG